jgi:hypothetical protein
MTIDRETMVNAAIKLEQNVEIASLILPEGKYIKYLRLILTCLGETAIFKETKNRWK